MKVRFLAECPTYCEGECAKSSSCRLKYDTSSRGCKLRIEIRKDVDGVENEELIWVSSRDCVGHDDVPKSNGIRRKKQSARR